MSQYAEEFTANSDPVRADLVRQRRAHRLLLILGVCVLALTLFEVSVGQLGFLIFFYRVLGPLGVGLIIALCSLGAYACQLAFSSRSDAATKALGLSTVVFAIFGSDNVLYYWRPLVAPNDTVEIVALAYAGGCIAVATRGLWVLRTDRRLA